jgi:predicted TPR repeat methyltransferase
MKRIMTALLLMLPSMSAAPADEPVTANLILQQAVAAAQSIEDPYGRANGLMRIAERQSVAGERAAATATLEKALNAAQLITDDDRRAIRLQAVAEA